MSESTAVVQRTAAEVAGFDSGVSLEGAQAGALAVVAREDTELKAAIVSAKHFPRDEAVAYTRIMKACGRPTMAEDATYSFPRGGQPVTGPSVYLAREAARCWGNIRHGLRIVELSEDQVHIRGYALDCETNAYAEAEDRFAPRVQRKRNGRTEWVTPDERDLRELINRRGAICVRNAILQVLPSDIIEDAIKAAATTLRKAAKGELEQNRDDAVRRIVLAFDRFGVTGDMITEHLGHEISVMTPDQLAELRQIYKSIEDGNSRVAEHFAMPSGRSEAAGGGPDLNQRVRERQQQQNGGSKAAPAQPQQKPAEPKAPEQTEQQKTQQMRAALDAAIEKHRPALLEDPEALHDFLLNATGNGDVETLDRSDMLAAIKALEKLAAEKPKAATKPAAAPEPAGDGLFED